MTIKPKDRIIFPLDFPDINSARKYIEILKDHIGMFKVGLELFVREGPAILKVISKEGRAKIFLDLKFHDIPETVKGAVESANALGAEFITIHCDEGKSLLETAVEAASNPPIPPLLKGAGHPSTGWVGGFTKVLAVTVLTNLSRKSLKEMGMREEFQDPMELVLHRAKIAKSAGCAGVVCSGLEAKYVKKELGKDFIVVTPGIRPSWAIVKGDDQQRVTTPFEAIKAGADYIVVGRPIRTAKNPADAAKKISEEIAAALRK